MEGLTASNKGKMVHLSADTTLIVGGGIGGLATAIALSDAGFPVHLIERAPEYSEVGAGLQIGPNGSRALDRLGVLEHLQSKAIFPERIAFHDIGSAEEITRIDLGPAFVKQFGYRYMVMHRSDLLDALLAKARRAENITLENNRIVSDVTIEGDLARVMCSDGLTYVTRRVVAADGNMSAVRRAVLGDWSPKATGYVVYRGTVPFQNMNTAANGNNIILYGGDRIHLIQYPIRGGELYNQAAVFLSERYDPSHDDWGTPDELEEAFRTVAPHVRDSVSRVNRTVRWPARDVDSFRPWHRGPVVLMGDAAHAMFQYVAQGACQALEDAVVLARCMTDEGGEPHAAFPAFEESRLLRTARVQLTARRFGEVIHSGGIEAEVRDRIMRARNPQDYSAVEWLYADQKDY